MTVHIGVVGCGKIAEKHLAAYKKLEGVRTTVTDIVPKGERVAERYGAAWNADPHSLVQSRSIDAVDVCVPTPVHAEFILSALEQGLHVFCEKPLASNLHEAEEIAKRAEASEFVVMVGYLYRFHPAYQLVKDVLSEEIIGAPHFALFRLGGRGSHKAWKHKRETGGGAANEMMVHMMDLAVWYFGMPQEIRLLVEDTLLPCREIEGKEVASEAEDLILLEMKMKANVRVLCQSDLITPSYMNYMEVHGENGSIFTSLLDYLPTTIYCKEAIGGYDRGRNLIRLPKVDLFERELGHFVDCVRHGQRPAVNSIEESLRVMRLLASIRERKINR